MALCPSTCCDTAHQPHHRNLMSLNVSQFSRGARWMATKQSLKSLPQIQGSVNFPSIPVLRRRVDFASFIIPCEPPLLCLVSEVWICLLSPQVWWEEIVLTPVAFASLVIPSVSVNHRELRRGRNILSTSECLFLNSAREWSLLPRGVAGFKSGFKPAHVTAVQQTLTFSFHTPANEKANLDVLRAFSTDMLCCRRVVSGLEVQCRVPTWLMGLMWNFYRLKQKYSGIDLTASATAIISPPIIRFIAICSACWCFFPPLNVISYKHMCCLVWKQHASIYLVAFAWQQCLCVHSVDNVAIHR